MVAIIIGADIFLTVLLQPKIYWLNYSDYSERNPLGILLGIHPLAFLYSGLLLLVLIYIFMITCKKEISLLALLYAVIFHVGPMMGWLDGALIGVLGNIPNEPTRKDVAFVIEGFLLAWITTKAYTAIKNLFRD